MISHETFSTRYAPTPIQNFPKISGKLSSPCPLVVCHEVSLAIHILAVRFGLAHGEIAVSDLTLKARMLWRQTTMWFKKWLTRDSLCSGKSMR